MCRSTQYIHSVVKESEDAKPSTSTGSEKDNFSILDQTKREPATASNGRHMQVKNGKDISSETNNVLWSGSTVNHSNAQDTSIALATFPEFFPQGLVLNQDTLVRHLEGQKLTSKGLSVRKQNLQHECGRLVLWYIREYGL